MDTRGRARTNKIFREKDPRRTRVRVLQRRAELWWFVSVIVEGGEEVKVGREECEGFERKKKRSVGQFSPSSDPRGAGAGTGSHPSAKDTYCTRFERVKVGWLEEGGR